MRRNANRHLDVVGSELYLDATGHASYGPAGAVDEAVAALPVPVPW